MCKNPLLITFIFDSLGFLEYQETDRKESNDRWGESLGYWEGTSFLMNVIFYLIWCSHSKIDPQTLMVTDCPWLLQYLDLLNKREIMPMAENLANF